MLEPIGMMGKEENDHQQIQRCEDNKGRDDEVVLPHTEEEDHGHDKGEQVQKGCLVRALYIAEREGMQVDKEDAEQGRDGRETFQVEENEDKQYKDANYFNSGAMHHTIRDVINKIDEVATHGHNDERIEPPEAGLRMLNR